MIEQLFFELICVAIGVDGCLSHTPKMKEWQELYAMAKTHIFVYNSFEGLTLFTFFN